MYDCYNGLEALAAVGDDYMYKLSWLVCEVRRHGYELKQIDQKIKDAVKDELSDERVQSIVEDIISNLSGIINVKTPPDELKPAVGDGSENDGEALQAIIDYAGQHGAAVYFPSGDYLTGPLTVPHDVSLYGYDRYQTRLVLAGGAETPMLEINGMGHTIQGITLDGNAANQVNEVVTLKVSGADILLTQLVIDNSYVGLDFSGTNGHLQMTDIIFGSMTAMAALIVGDVKVQAEQLIFNSLSAIKGEYVIEIGANRGSYQFASVATCETCLNLTGNDNHIEMDCINAANDYQDTGRRNTIYVYGKSEKVQLSGDKDVTVRGSQSINVDGSSSTNVGLNESTVVQGNRNLGVIGKNTESYTGNSTQDYSGNRVSNVKGKDTLNAGDLVLNPVNPLTYRTPTPINDWFSGIPAKDYNNSPYEVLVKSPLTSLIKPLVYDVTAYGIMPDSGDIYSELYDFLYGSTFDGGIVFFPKGTYTLSYTIMIPSGTIFIGEGERTVIFFNESDVAMGVGLGNSGSNVGIMNMKVNSNDTGPFEGGNQAGSIGLGNWLDMGKNGHDFTKKTNAENLYVENIWCDTKYPIQVEPLEGYYCKNVVYRNIIAPIGCVSIYPGTDAPVYNFQGDNIICSFLRVGRRAHTANAISLTNITCNSLTLDEAEINISNLTVTAQIKKNQTLYPGYCVRLGSGTVNMVNAIIDGENSGQYTAAIGNFTGNFYLTNVTVKGFNQYYSYLATDSSPLFLTNCNFSQTRTDYKPTMTAEIVNTTIMPSSGTITAWNRFENAGLTVGQNGNWGSGVPGAIARRMGNMCTVVGLLSLNNPNLLFTLPTQMLPKYALTIPITLYRIEGTEENPTKTVNAIAAVNADGEATLTFPKNVYTLTDFQAFSFHFTYPCDNRRTV